MSGDQESTSLAMIQASLKRMEKRLSNICSDVESEATGNPGAVYH